MFYRHHCHYDANVMSVALELAPLPRLPGLPRPPPRPPHGLVSVEAVTHTKVEPLLEVLKTIIITSSSSSLWLLYYLDLVVVIVDHLEVEGQVGVVQHAAAARVAAAPLVVTPEVVPEYF